LVGASFLARVLRRCGVLLITPLRILKWFLQSLSVQCYSLSTLCSIFCCMNAMTLFSFPCCLHGLSSQYTILLSETKYFMILFRTHESHNILSVFYWRMLTIMSVEYYIAMKYFTICSFMWATILSLTTDVCWQ
jgi:hypothetical protein